ncbi:MAG TPA: L-threonylcarbamoyladenylate synthase [Burkholderiaceae bacterium]|jgi:tRNA threonylcarbamoyl adenosine modification protein (Sua5/YciO/YrdC/YwlC family)|nr:L-threonylcarbamoyladenylate synthase [Burkholderiaceae bacterium]
MAQLFSIHPHNPQVRLLKQAARILDAGGIGAIPSDSSYALVCHLDDKRAVDRIRLLRRLDERHLMTLMCRDLSEIAAYAQVDNATYRLLRQATPGPFTFILEATREVPRRLSHPSRKTIGIRVPAHAVALGLLAELAQPLIATTLQLPGDLVPMTEAGHIRTRLQHELDLVIDSGSCGLQPTTVIDLTGPSPVVARLGSGNPAAVGLT